MPASGMLLHPSLIEIVIFGFIGANLLFAGIFLVHQGVRRFTARKSEIDQAAGA